MKRFVAIAVLTFGCSASSDPAAAQPAASQDAIAVTEGAGLYLAAGRGPRRTTAVDNSRIARSVTKRKRGCKRRGYDARCIRVISDPAIVPPGVNVMVPTSARNNRSEDRRGKDTGSEYYPACSRKDTDNCVQTYERTLGPQ